MRRLQVTKLRQLNDGHVGRHLMRRHKVGHRNVHAHDNDHDAKSYMTRRLKAKRPTYATTLRRGNRLPIPCHPTGWRIGMRLFFKLMAYKAVQVSPNPKGALLHGRFQSSRIRSAYPNAIANRSICDRNPRARLLTAIAIEAPITTHTTTSNLKEANDD